MVKIAHFNICFSDMAGGFQRPTTEELYTFVSFSDECAAIEFAAGVVQWFKENKHSAYCLFCCSVPIEFNKPQFESGAGGICKLDSGKQLVMLKVDRENGIFSVAPIYYGMVAGKKLTGFSSYPPAFAYACGVASGYIEIRNMSADSYDRPLLWLGDNISFPQSPSFLFGRKWAGANFEQLCREGWVYEVGSCK